MTNGEPIERALSRQRNPGVTVQIFPCAGGRNCASVPSRIWDPVRHVWIEALTGCRGTDGKYVRKTGSEPASQLVLP